MKADRNSLLPAFTLIELMVVVTIISLVTLMTYLPYAHHQKKVLVKQASKEFSQSLQDGRNLAIHGLNTWSWNLNVGLFFGSWAQEIIYYTSTGALTLWSLDPNNIYKKKALPKGVVIDSIDGISEDILFSYEAISGNISIEPSLWDEFDISFSYMWSSSPVLQESIHYYTKSYISDY